MKRDNSITRRFLTGAGIGPGMRVLEIGCGNGEMTQLIAELVGSTGSIFAVDRDETALANARERLSSVGFDSVHFASLDLSGELGEIVDHPTDSFDALAGRRVLMYLDDPGMVVGRLSGWLRSGGLAVFEETDSTMVPARTAAMPAHDVALDWLKGMLLSEGANPAMGFDLPATLAQAGLNFEKVRAEAVIQGQGTQFPLSDLLKRLQDRIVESGVASQSEVECLCDHIETECSDPTRVYVSEMSFCAWARKP